MEEPTFSQKVQEQILADQDLAAKLNLATNGVEALDAQAAVTASSTRSLMTAMYDPRQGSRAKAHRGQREKRVARDRARRKAARRR